MATGSLQLLQSWSLLTTTSIVFFLGGLFAYDDSLAHSRSNHAMRPCHLSLIALSVALPASSFFFYEKEKTGVALRGV